MSLAPPRRVLRFIGSAALATAALLFPPLFSRVLCMEPLLPGDRIVLYAVAAAVATCGIALLALPLRLARPMVPATLCVLALVNMEIGARVAAKWLMSDQTQGNVLSLGAARSLDVEPFVAQPFVQYTGNPDAGYNPFGFSGPALDYGKDEGVLRVLCLGGSTTEGDTGYPHRLEGFLEEHGGDLSGGYEVLNFGLSGWSSAHSLVNFVLNGVDFAPDYVVIHQGWNDFLARDSGCSLVGDYSHHAFPTYGQAFSPTERALLGSMVYRLGKALTQPATTEHTRPAMRAAPHGPECTEVDELWPFRRNIQTLVDVATARDATVVLTTQPRALELDSKDYPDPALKTRHLDIDAHHIDECNAVMREVYAEERGDALMVDLAQEMTGVAEHVFKDLAHVNEDGHQLKAEAIGRAILADLRADSGQGDDPPDKIQD